MEDTGREESCAKDDKKLLAMLPAKRAFLCAMAGAIELQASQRGTLARNARSHTNRVGIALARDTCRLQGVHLPASVGQVLGH